MVFVAFQGCRLWVHPRVYCFWSPLDWIISWLAYWSTKCWDCLCCWRTQLQSVGGKNNRQQTRWCREPVSFWRYSFLSSLLVVLHLYMVLVNNYYITHRSVQFLVIDDNLETVEMVNSLYETGLQGIIRWHSCSCIHQSKYPVGDD